MMTLSLEADRESDGRWLAEIPELPGVMVYGRVRKEAIAGAKAIALRVLADRREHGDGDEIGPETLVRIARRTGLKPEDL